MVALPPDLARLDKRALLRAIDEQLTTELDAAAARARATAASATHEESRAESDKDTRAIEESYLARGQAQRVADLETDRGRLRSTGLGAFDGGPIAVGALVRLEDDDGDDRVVFLVGAGGGRRVELDGVSVQLVTPHAPLGAALIGREVDDEIDLSLRGRLRALCVVDVA